MVENLKSIILSHSKSDAVKSRFTKEITVTQKVSVTKNLPEDDEDASVTPKPNKDTDRNIKALKMSVLDLFPDQEEKFIEVESLLN